MNKLNIILIVFISVLQSACASFCGQRPECTPIVKKYDSKIEISGISIPLNPIKNMHIGKVEWTPQQLQILSESATRMEQYRLIQCSSLSVLRELKPQPVERIVQLIQELSKANFELQRLYLSVPNSTDPAKTVEEIEKYTDGVIAATSASNLSQSQEGIKLPISENKCVPVLDEKLGLVQSTLDKINTAIASHHLSAHLPTCEKSIELVVGGFKLGETNLSARMKAQLLADLNAVIEASSKQTTVFIDVIGYADTTGNHIKNIGLGLNRARSVAAFITESQALAKGKLRLVASAGAMEIAPFGRQVKLVLYFPGAKA